MIKRHESFSKISLYNQVKPVIRKQNQCGAT